MKTLFFAVNKKHKTFFKTLKEKVNSNGKIIYSKSIFLPSLKSLKYINQVDLSAPITLKTRDFHAKFGYLFLKPIINLLFTLLAYFNYLRYYKIIDSSYDQIVVWNGTLFRQAIVVEIAKLYHMDIIYTEIGLLPNRITFDRKGVNYHNSVPRDKTFYENYTHEENLPNELVPRNPKNAQKFSNVKKTVLPNSYIFIPFQVDYDTQILVNSPWIKDMRMLYNVIEKIAISTPNIHFVFKEHPSSKKNYPDLHKKSKNLHNLLFANGHATQELIENSSAIVTINSTVGIEALLFHKRVIVLGNAFYNIGGITKHVSNKTELHDTINNLINWDVDKSLIDNFLKYLYYEYLFPTDSLNANQKLEMFMRCKKEGIEGN